MFCSLSFCCNVDEKKKSRTNRINDKKLENCFKILGLEIDSNLKQVKSQYKLLAKKWHPDLQNNIEKLFFRENEIEKLLVNSSELNPNALAELSKELSEIKLITDLAKKKTSF